MLLASCLGNDPMLSWSFVAWKSYWRPEKQMGGGGGGIRLDLRVVVPTTLNFGGGAAHCSSGRRIHKRKSWS